MEGRGKCRAILSRSSVAPLDVLMHVENNLTANLLHSFSFLFRTFRPASAAHLPDPSFCTLSDEKRERALLSDPVAPLTFTVHLPSLFLRSENRLRERAAPLSYLIEYIIWIFELYDEKGAKREAGRTYTWWSREVRLGTGQTCRAINLSTLWRFGEAAEGLQHADILICVPYGSSLARIRFLCGTRNNLADGDHLCGWHN